MDWKEQSTRVWAELEAAAIARFGASPEAEKMMAEAFIRIAASAYGRGMVDGVIMERNRASNPEPQPDKE